MHDIEDRPMVSRTPSPSPMVCNYRIPETPLFPPGAYPRDNRTQGGQQAWKNFSKILLATGPQGHEAPGINISFRSGRLQIGKDIGTDFI
eukprot:5288608-Amphidinium_carterae.1